MTISRRLATLEEAGVEIIDPRQTWVGPEVRLERIGPRATLHPGTRLQGERCWIGSGAEVGTEGPATLVDTVLDEGARVASGYAERAVLLRGASLGGAAHVRGGTLLEEEASTAHAVGLKQTILLSFVTLGSLINFCDCLMAGGRSRNDHSEVGSGFIHFNFTPWGERGDKATPSLVGDVPSGVFLRDRRIFLGGAGGLVGPAVVGYGSVLGAGQVQRGDVPPERMVLAPPSPIDRSLVPSLLGRVQPRARKNLFYIGQVYALREWYRQVRLPRIPEGRRPVIQAALENLDSAIEERVRQLTRFLNERGVSSFRLEPGQMPACPLELAGNGDHVTWVQQRSEAEVQAGREWLVSIVQRVVDSAEDLPPVQEGS